jgi:hypothetical protein
MPGERPLAGQIATPCHDSSLVKHPRSNSAGQFVDPWKTAGRIKSRFNSVKPSVFNPFNVPSIRPQPRSGSAGDQKIDLIDADQEGETKPGGQQAFLWGDQRGK